MYVYVLVWMFFFAKQLLPKYVWLLNKLKDFTRYYILFGFIWLQFNVYVLGRHHQRRAMSKERKSKLNIGQTG